MRQAGQGQSPADWYWSLPPVTRTHGTAVVAVFLLTFLGLLPAHHLALYWPWVLRRLQVWRLLTNFLVLGSGFGFLIRLLWIVQYGVKLEEATFAGNTADYAFMLLFDMAGLLGLSVFIPRPALGSALIFALIYVWSRNFGSSRVSFFGLVQVPAAYLAFALAAMDLLTNNDWVGDLMGVAVGHTYWFFKDVHPSAGGRRYLETPVALQRLLLRWGVGGAPARDVPLPPNPSAPSLRAFHGRARRLDE